MVLFCNCLHTGWRSRRAEVGTLCSEFRNLKLFPRKYLCGQDKAHLLWDISSQRPRRATTLGFYFLEILPHFASLKTFSLTTSLDFIQSQETLAGLDVFQNIHSITSRPKGDKFSQGIKMNFDGTLFFPEIFQIQSVFPLLTGSAVIDSSAAIPGSNTINKPWLFPVFDPSSNLTE